MNEDFVTFELAKKLKKKGFDKECFAHYDDLGNLLLDKDYWKLDSHILAPIISQVLKWLREEKEIMVFPVYSTNTSKWYCVAINADSLEQYKLSLSDSYEEAAIAGIKYVIDNLI